LRRCGSGAARLSWLRLTPRRPRSTPEAREQQRRALTLPGGEAMPDIVVELLTARCPAPAGCGDADVQLVRAGSGASGSGDGGGGAGGVPGEAPPCMAIAELFRHWVSYHGSLANC
jgi:hypothetical protein